MNTVYPRPRGEATGPRRLTRILLGLSPPTRGSRRGDAVGERRHGSIPAHAGKPGWRLVVVPSGRVYPRPRGEACSRPRPSPSPGGLSPPTRGSPGRRADRGGPDGSIPAHAGKPLAYEVDQSLAGGQYGVFLTDPRSEWQVVAFFRRHRAPREKHAVAIPDLLGRIAQTIQPQPSSGF